ncbi:MAG: lipid A deacylase LpxR family protein [Gemmatimonadota bacterium]
MTELVQISVTRACLAALILLLGLSPTPGSGQGLRSFIVSADNDGFVFWNPPDERTDWYYTHGLRAEAVAAWAPPGAGFLGAGDPVLCPPDPTPDPCVVTRITFGQAIYTPAMLFSTDPPMNDRPYAGWLFAEATVARVAPDRLTSLGLQVGLTGKPSLAGPTHRWFHRSLGKHEPEGWEYQIPFEPAFALSYEARRAWTLAPATGAMSLHVEPRGFLTLGTLRTGALAGVSLSGGWNAPPSLDWLGAGPGSSYLLVGLGLEGELVLHDLFLDGSTWSQSAHVERVPVVGRLSGRLQMGLRGFGLEFAATRSTVQFTGQKGMHTVGTIRIIIRA